MLGTGMQLMSRNGDDRFYRAVRARRSRNQCNRLKRAQSDITGIKLYNKLTYCDDVADEKDDEKASATAAVFPEFSLTQLELPLCNMERFLKSIVPSVPVQYPSQSTIRERRTCATEIQPYFVLGDLFESMKEWSAYGVGVPLTLKDNFSVVQYYVPYLSGIQLYVEKSKSLAKSMRHGEDSDVDSFRDSSSSDWSSDSENCITSSIPFHKQRAATTEGILEKNQLLFRDIPVTSPEDSSDESEPDSSQGCLLFEYFEKDNPYGREPLAEKISQLALRFPELKTLRSCDLLQSSWISVAWYPIYRIPMGHTLRDLDACFLTFHCLHTPITATGNEVGAPRCEMAMGIPKISLPVFGLSCYKFNATAWVPTGGIAYQLFTSLLQDAETWINQLQVNHPDFLFFQRR